MRRGRGAKATVHSLETITWDGEWCLPTFVHTPSVHPSLSLEMENDSRLINNYEQSTTSTMNNRSTSSKSSSSNDPPILLISGWTGVASDWGYIPRALATRTGRTVITYDARGMGHAKPQQHTVSSNTKEESSPTLELTLHQMASDAISVVSSVTSSFQPQQNNRSDHVIRAADHTTSYSSKAATNINGEYPKKESRNISFSIGGVSMGGMIAQLIAGAAHGRVSLPHSEYDSIRNNSNSDSDSDNNTSNDLNVMSLALIATTPGGSPPRHPPSRDFFRVFDDWTDCLDDTDDVGGAAIRARDNHHHYTNNRRCVESFFRKSLGDDFLHELPRSPGRRVLWNRLIAEFLRTRRTFPTEAGAGIAAQRRALRAFDSSEYLPYIGGGGCASGDDGGGIPSLIVHGKKDRVVPYGNALELHQMLGDTAKLTLLEECGHLVWVTHSNQLVKQLSEFFGPACEQKGFRGGVV